jgi:hypothetical protein
VNYSIPSSVAVAAWAALFALVAAYTAKAYAKTAKDLPAGPQGDFTPGADTTGGGDFASTDPGFG